MTSEQNESLIGNWKISLQYLTEILQKYFSDYVVSH